MPRSFLRSPLLIVSAVLAAGGCDSSAPTAPSPSTGSAIALIVSDPARAPQTSSGAIGAGLAANLHLNEGSAYVSAVPGTVAGATSVEIENLRLHQSTAATLADGGFDPVAIPAIVGDSIEIRFELAGGGLTAVRAAVPARRRPRVVRTHPIRGRRDVAINSVISTIFSEPINPTTLRDSTVRLLRDGVAVRGTVRLTPGPVPGVEFVPAEALVPATTYHLVLDGRIVDLSGDPLEVPEPVEFVTFGEGGTGALTVITRTGGTDAPDGYDVMVDGRFAERIGITDTVVISGLGAGGHHILLSAMSDYCYATGGLYRQATLTRTQDATVTFNVTCTDLPQLELRVTTTGVELDEDGYTVTVNRMWNGAVPPQGTLELAAIRYGVNVVSLEGIRGNCRDAAGPRRLVNLTSGQTGTVSFSLTCTPAFTPAGRIAYASYLPEGGSAIMVADADGSNRIQLTSGAEHDRFPVWSPDGSRIAFLRGREWGGNDVYVMNADGSAPFPRVMNFSRGEITSLTWLAGGQELAFGGGEEVFVAPAIGPLIDGFDAYSMRSVPVWGLGNGHAWSPVDAKIAWVWGRTIRIADRGGTYLREIVDNAAGASTWSDPAWSPDGRRIAVFACRDVIEGECSTLSLELLPAFGTGRAVLPLPGWIHRPVWSRDGSTFAYTPCAGCQGISYMRTDGRGTSVTIEDGFDPAWRP
jgi:Tol biopolymer transport system component